MCVLAYGVQYNIIFHCTGLKCVQLYNKESCLYNQMLLVSNDVHPNIKTTYVCKQVSYAQGPYSINVIEKNYMYLPMDKHSIICTYPSWTRIELYVLTHHGQACRTGISKLRSVV